MRIRITFEKTEAMRYTGHLDLHRTWERTFRRANLPLAYSQGFHPQPRINLACALPLGFTSQCEILDAWLEAEYDVEKITKDLNSTVPPGIEISYLEAVDPHLPSLQSQVRSAEYVITLLEPPEDLTRQLKRIIEASELPRRRRNKSYDLRPLIEALTLTPRQENRQIKLIVKMTAREGATGRPEELLDELGIPFNHSLVHRRRLFFGEADE